MTEVLPRRVYCSELERTRPVGHFIQVNDSDDGISLVHSFRGKGRLHDLSLIRGHDSPGLLVSPKPGRKVLDLESGHYASIPILFDSERSLRSASAAQLFEYIPKKEIEICGGFEIIYLGLSGYGRHIDAEMRLYQRAR